MKHAVPLFLVAVGFAALAMIHGGWVWLLLWPACAFAVVAVAYAGLGLRVFGKRSDGTIPPSRRIVLAPYFHMSIGVLHLKRVLTREAFGHEIAPGIWVGRRIARREIPPGTKVIVDLTAEFQEPENVRRNVRYLCLPTLDASVPAIEDLRALLNTLTDEPGPIYIHCASGHGRSVMVAAGLLVRKQLAKTVTEAETMIRNVRPHIRLSAAQRRFLETALKPL